MHVALVIGSLDRGGSEGQVVEFVREAHPHYATCTMICLRHEGPMARDIREAGVDVITLGIKSPRRVDAFPRVFHALRKLRPDVVYGFLFGGYCLAIPPASALSPRPLRIQGRRSHPDADVPRTRSLRVVRPIVDRLSDAVVANSHAVADACVADNPRLSERIHVIHNGVRIPARAAEGSRPGAPAKIACVANLIPYKGHDVLLAALERLHQQRTDWTVELIGDGPEGSRLRTEAETRGLSGRVHFAGLCSDVPERLLGADVLVLPSLTEGLPNAVLEAMAAGVPVVASEVGGVPELIGAGGGIMVPPGDPIALESAIARFLAEPQERQRQGAIGRARAIESFSTKAMCERTVSLFDQLLAERRPSVRADGHARSNRGARESQPPRGRRV